MKKILVLLIGLTFTFAGFAKEASTNFDDEPQIEIDFPLSFNLNFDNYLSRL